MKKFILIIVVCFTFIQCTTNFSSYINDSQTDDLKKECCQKILDYMNNYVMSDDTCALDSALFFIDMQSNEIQNSIDIIGGKIWILDKKGDYKTLIEYLNNLPDSTINFMYDMELNYKEIMILRFKAVKAIIDDYNYDQAHIYVKEILKLLSDYCDSKKTEITANLETQPSPDYIIGNAVVALSLYYPYYSFVYGKDQALEKLNQLFIDYPDPSDNNLYLYIKSSIEHFNIMSPPDIY